MRSSDERELEREIHAALRALPSPRAPVSLAPSVMAAVMAGSASWRRWPLPARIIGAAAACALAAVVLAVVPAAGAWVSGLAAARAAAALWTTLIAPLAAPVIIFTAVMGTASVLLMAAIKHVAWEGQEASR